MIKDLSRIVDLLNGDIFPRELNDDTFKVYIHEVPPYGGVQLNFCYVIDYKKVHLSKNFNNELYDGLSQVKETILNSKLLAEEKRKLDEYEKIKSMEILLDKLADMDEIIRGRMKKNEDRLSDL